MTTTDTEYLAQTLHKANALKAVLDKEFSALKEQDMTAFETLQAQKLEILTFLSSDDLLERVKAYTEKSDTAAANLALWDEVMQLIAECRDLHRRNEVLISRKLESIRGALQTIQSNDPLSSVEVYDRLGKIRQGRSRQSMGDA
ncbi:flagellar protein FlgN [Porticoccaceae bacterium]|nr:flagellar protein FlgN [Porticoccaceae bacterium]MDB4077295.1 flagellar protein FlgN [Porticoccaceae bacterium]MDB9999579.1 flagellar protein FlgN [Porticoccaceae bacterium]